MNITVGKHTYNHGGRTFNVDQIQYKHFGYDGNDVIIGSFTSIGYNCIMFMVDGRGHEYKTGSTWPFGILQLDVFNKAVIVPPYAHRGDIVIGSDVWIGESVTILSGVTIGHGSVVATNTHVHKSIEPYSIVGGNPSQLIKPRFSEDIVEEFMKLRWWEFEDSIINDMMPVLQLPPTLESIRGLREKYR